MLLPNGEAAIVELSKLKDYCLDPDHPRGRHKARVFAATLGLNQSHASLLRDRLLLAGRTEEALPGARDEFGQRYTLDFEMTHLGRRARLRSGWMVRHSDPDQYPRLISCFVL